MIDSDAILTRLRAVLEAATGTLRTISATRFQGGYYEDLSQDGKSKRAVYRPVTDAKIVRIERHEASPPWQCNLALYKILVEVRVGRHINVLHKVDDAVRDDVKGLAANDADVIAQAFTYLGNLDSTTTGLVSGVLNYEGSDVGTILLEDDSAGLIETVHEFSGVVQTTLATS